MFSAILFFAIELAQIEDPKQHPELIKECIQQISQTQALYFDLKETL
jgi:hypothetical protein